MSGAIGNDIHISFRPCAFNFIIFNDELLLQHFDGVELLRSFCLGKHDFTKISFTEDCQEIEMIKSDSPIRGS